LLASQSDFQARADQLRGCAFCQLCLRH
jgi:hypothetical protein